MDQRLTDRREPTRRRVRRATAILGHTQQMLIAALPPAEPPARVIAGVKVVWPLSEPATQLAPGTSLTVRVSSAKRRAAIALVRVNQQGRVLRRVAGKTLRTGSFTVT